jgi:hypothetical protein
MSVAELPGLVVSPDLARLLEPVAAPAAPIPPEPELEPLFLQPNVMTIGADAEAVQTLLRAPELRLLCNFSNPKNFASRVGEYGGFVIDAVVLFGPKAGEDIDPVEMSAPLRWGIRELQPYPRRIYIAQRYTSERAARSLRRQNYSRVLNVPDQREDAAWRANQVAWAVGALVGQS